MSLLRIASRQLLRNSSVPKVTSVRSIGGPPKLDPIDPLKDEKYDLGSMDIPEQALPPDEIFAADVWKAEIGFKLKGIVDPFDMALKPMVGGLTPDMPNYVPAFEAHRTVACLCHEDNFHFNYMVLWEGELTQCKCGWWWQLIRLNENMHIDDVPRDLVNQLMKQNEIMAEADIEDYKESQH